METQSSAFSNKRDQFTCCCVSVGAWKMPLCVNKLFILKLHQIFIRKFNFYFIGGWMSLCTFFFVLFTCFGCIAESMNRCKTKQSHQETWFLFEIVGSLLIYLPHVYDVAEVVFSHSHAVLKLNVIDREWLSSGNLQFISSWACLGVIPPISVGSSRFSHLNLDYFIESWRIQS